MIADPVLEISRPGLRRNYLSGFELVAQSLGTLAPSASSVVLVPIIFATAGNSTWLVFVFAVFALLLLAGQMRVFGLRLASPGALYAYVSDAFGPLAGVVTENRSGALTTGRE